MSTARGTSYVLPKFTIRSFKTKSIQITLTGSLSDVSVATLRALANRIMCHNQATNATRNSHTIATESTCVGSAFLDLVVGRDVQVDAIRIIAFTEF